MQMEAEALLIITLGFALVILISLVMVIRLWVKFKSNTYIWFLAQIALLIAAFFKFVNLLRVNPNIPKAMLSEENSLALGIIGVLWACSMLCMLIGIAKLGKERFKETALDRVKEEYYPSIKKVIGMLLFYTLVCALAISIPIGIASQVIGFSEKDPLVYVFTTLSQLGLLILWLKRKYTIDFKSMFSREKTSVMLFIPMALTITGSGILLSEVDNLMRRILPMSDFWINIFNTLLGDGFSTWKGILAVVVIAPIVEEIIFRGLILRGFLKHYSVRKSIIISALLFGIVHMNPWQFVSASFAGIILGWWYVKTDSILGPVFGHALNNGMSFIVGLIGVSIPGYNAAFDTAKHQPLWFDLLGVIMLVGGVLWSIKLFNAKKVDMERNNDNQRRTNF
jgi:uncharacterized protein